MFIIVVQITNSFETFELLAQTARQIGCEQAALEAQCKLQESIFSKKQTRSSLSLVSIWSLVVAGTTSG
jgi:hypothetical protein